MSFGNNTSSITYGNLTAAGTFGNLTTEIFQRPFIVSYLMIGGGGGGGSASTNNVGFGGGGGAGGYKTTWNNEPSGGGATAPAFNAVLGTNYRIRVGSGGTGVPGGGSGSSSNQGGPTSILEGASPHNNIISVLGGGYGGFGSNGSSATSGGSGGSGGGGGSAITNTYSGGQYAGVNWLGGASTNGFGYEGTNGNYGGHGYLTMVSGGGGGAGGTGTRTGTTAANHPGNSSGLASTITGTSVDRAGGGGGGGYYSRGATIAGSGRGGYTYHVAENGTANTGSGGGGAGYYGGSASITGEGGNGGSGIMVFRYPQGYNITIISGSLVHSTSQVENDNVTIFTAGDGILKFN